MHCNENREHGASLRGNTMSSFVKFIAFERFAGLSFILKCVQKHLLYRVR